MSELKTNPQPRRWKYGFKRWLVVALIVLEIVLAGVFAPIKPAVELAAEPIVDPGGGSGEKGIQG